MIKCDVPVSDRDHLPEPSSGLVDLLQCQLVGRPTPFRIFDQIHMNIEDAARHIQLLSTYTEGKRIVFMGDSDGIALGLINSAGNGLVPAPASVTLCDFDDRVLDFVRAGVQTFASTPSVAFQRYNVFAPLPHNLKGAFDFFHTNPPYGMYNNGKSVIAFLMRCFEAVRHSGDGIVVLGNDSRRSWTGDVLRSVLEYLVEREITPSRIFHRIHRYAIDDDPELESGMVYCHSVPSSANTHDSSWLGPEFLESFYGRETISIPEYISSKGAIIYGRGLSSGLDPEEED